MIVVGVGMTFKPIPVIVIIDVHPILQPFPIHARGLRCDQAEDDQEDDPLREVQEDIRGGYSGSGRVTRRMPQLRGEEQGSREEIAIRQHSPRREIVAVKMGHERARDDQAVRAG